MKIFYDGDCYFCSNFVNLLRLREAVGGVELISLRDDNEDVRRILSTGLNVNAGFVVEHDGRTFHGAYAFHHLNTLVKPENMLSRVLLFVGKRERVARVVYPLMAAGRYLLLITQGGALIGDTRTQLSNGIGPRLVRLSVLLLGLAGLARLLLEKRYPLSGLFTFNVKLLTVVCGSLWAALFVRAHYAADIYRMLRTTGWQGVALYVCLWLTIVNLMDMIALRRIVGFLAVLPLVGIAIDLWRYYERRPGVGRVPALTPLALLLFAFLPGLYLAPFYGGIAGWTLTVDHSSPIHVSGYKLVNDHGEEIWYNHAFFQPISMNGRFNRAFAAAGSDTTRFPKFMLETYARIYPTLEGGRMPHEWALGRFAYPSHNLSDSNALDYVGRFAPHRLVGIRHVSEQYTRDGRLISAAAGEIVPTSVR